MAAVRGGLCIRCSLECSFPGLRFSLFRCCSEALACFSRFHASPPLGPAQSCLRLDETSFLGTLLGTIATHVFSPLGPFGRLARNADEFLLLDFFGAAAQRHQGGVGIPK